jgi:parallel beta-helix repeat protein
MGLRYSMGSWLTPGEDMVTIVSAGTFPLVQLTGGVNGSGGGIHGLCLSNVNSNTPDVIGLKVDSNGAWMSDGYIDNVWFLRTKFVANMMQGFTCRDNVFDASSGNMMEIYRGENNWITNNRTCIPGLINASSVGLYMGAYNGNPCMGNIVANNTFDNAGMTVGGNGSMGVHLASAVGTAITGNMIGFNNIGIKISSASNSTTITGNVFQGNSAEGVLIDGSDSCIINSNTFDPLYRTGTAQTNTPYVKTLNSASRIIVTNNLMKSNVRTYGVEFSTGTTKSLIDNLVVNGISNPINDLGGNTIGTVIS